MIYLPTDNTYNKCYIVQNENVIRAYDRVPQNNITYYYRDYYINSDYIYKDGSGSWGQYTTLPICLDNNVITHEYFYRLDYYKSLIIFSIMFIFIILIPILIILKFFKKGKVLL